MGIVITNNILFKFSLTNSTLCDFCGQSLEDKKHLFRECEQTQHFWTNKLNRNVFNFGLDFENISLGIPDLKQTKHQLTIFYRQQNTIFFHVNVKKHQFSTITKTI